MTAVPVGRTMMDLTAAQEAIWLDEQFAGDDGVLHTMADYLDIEGVIDETRLVDAIASLVDEAQALRIEFATRDGRPAQLLRPSTELRAVFVDARAPLEDENAALERALERIEDEAQERIALDGGPLARVSVHRVAEHRVLVSLVAHHAVLDGFSRLPLYARLAELYRGAADAAALPPLKTLVDGEADYRASAAFLADQAFWRSSRGRQPDALRLSPGPVTAGRSHRRVSLALSADEVHSVRDAAAVHGCTWSVLAIAAAGAALVRLADREAGTITLPVAARMGAGARATPGMVANYVPLVIDGLHGTPREYLSGIARSVLQTLRHQRFRGEAIARLDGSISEGRAPFGPFVNVLPQEPVLDLGAARASVRNVTTGVVDDLNITFTEEAGDRLGIHVNGNPDRYPESILREYLAAVRDSVVALAVAKPDAPMARSQHRAARPVPSATEHGSTTDPGEDFLVAFRRQVDARPDAQAVDDGSTRLTYRELLACASALSAQVRPGDVVGIAAESSTEFVVGVVAALLARAAWLPIDVGWPPARITALIDDSMAVRVWTDGAGAAAVAEARLAVPAAAIDEAFGHAGDTLAAPPERLAHIDEDIAYVLYTSGTTGRPKGAMVHRGGMANHLLSKLQLLALGPGDVVVQNAPVTFDVSIWQMLAPLMVGGSTRPMGRDLTADPDAIARIVADEAVTVLEVVPSLLRAAIGLWSAEHRSPLLDLRWLMVTGEALSADLARAWTRFAPGIPLINAYGPTECSDDVAHAVIERVDETAASMPIGRPIPNVRLMVLDDGLRRVAVGLPGELYVSGASVGSGYLADPARTAATFVAAPDGSGQRMYRTGDIVRWREDGELEFLERVDFQVKVNGQRVELGEIESIIRAIDAIEDAVVTATRNPGGGTRLSAFVVGADRSATSADRLRERLVARLPIHMVPADILFLEALPLTPHGKVDRAALDALRAPRTATSAATDPVGGEAVAEPGIVRDVVEVFSGVLSSTATEGTDFFRAGGDSIGVIQVVSKLRERGVVIRPRDIFDLRTPTALAARAGMVEEPAPSGGSTAFVSSGVVPPTPIALQLAREARSLDTDGRTSAQWCRLKAPDGLTAAALSALLDALRRAHPILDSRAVELARGVWEQRLEAGSAWSVEESLDPSPERAAAVAVAALDPGEGVMGAAVIIDGAASREIVLALHHLVVDGVSWRIICDDLTTGWAMQVAGHEVVMPAEHVSFEEWAHRQGVAARSDGLIAEELELWDACRTDPAAPILDAEADIIGSAAVHRSTIAAPTTSEILRVGADRFRVEITDLLLGALASAIDGIPEMVALTGRGGAIEVEGHGREPSAVDDDLDLSRTVGWFTSSYPVLTREQGVEGGEPPASTPLRSVRRVAEARRRMPHRGIGFGMINDLNARTAHLFAADRPRIGFNYLGRFNAPGGALDWSILGGDSLGPIRTAESSSARLRHGLQVTAAVDETAAGPSLVVEWRYAPRLLDPGTVDRLAVRWAEALDELVRDRGTSEADAILPSHSPLIAVEQEELDDISRRLGRIDRLLPTTPTQRGMLFHASGTDDTDPYRISISVLLDGVVDEVRLAAAISATIGAHPVLANSFTRLSDGRLAAVQQETPVEAPVQVVPGAGPRPDGSPSAAGARGIDPWSGPLAEVVVRREGPAQVAVDWSMHHAVVDGWSMGVLFGEVLDRYADRAVAAPSSSFEDYLGRIVSSDDERSIARWVDVLDGAQPLRAFGLAPRSAERREHETLEIDLGPGALESLQHVARGNGVTEAVVVEAAWAAMLAQLTGHRDVLFGRVVSGRTAGLSGEEAIVGMLLNTVPTRVRVEPDDTLGTVLDRLQAHRALLWDDELVDVGRVVKAVPTLASRGEIYDTAVIVQNIPRVTAAGQPFDIADLRVRDSRHYALSVSVELVEHLRLTLDYDPNFVDVDALMSARAALMVAFEEIAAGALPTALRCAAGEQRHAAPIAPIARNARAHRDPVGDREVRIASAFATALGAGAVSADDDFFALGGDSITAIAVIEHVRSAGLQISPREVFEHRTPAALAAAARALDATPSAPGIADIAFDADDLDRELGF